MQRTLFVRPMLILAGCMYCKASFSKKVLSEAKGLKDCLMYKLEIRCVDFAFEKVC